MKVMRTERHLIKRSNPMWEKVDLFSFYSKKLYNMGNYIIKTEFEKTGRWIRNYELDKILQPEWVYRYELCSQSSQCQIILLDKNWKSFFKGIKDWSNKKGSNYNNMPRMPKYKEHRSIFMLKNLQCKIRNGKLDFVFAPFREFSGIPTKVTGKLMEVRFIPMGTCYYMEVVYETDALEKIPTNNSIIGIDLGVSNFATITNNIGLQPIVINGRPIKSMNQYFNKKLSTLRSRLKGENGWSNKMEFLNIKRREKIEYFMHCASKHIIDYCLTHGIDTIVIGKNDGWKDEVKLGKRNNQNFVFIPYEKFITKLRYKAENVGINFIETNESYTSGTSFLDNELPVKSNYDKSRRLKRGLFRSNDGTLINADVNGSYQIIKKVFPKLFDEGRNRGCGLHPVIVSL